MGRKGEVRQGWTPEMRRLHSERLIREYEESHYMPDEDMIYNIICPALRKLRKKKKRPLKSKLPTVRELHSSVHIGRIPIFKEVV